MTPQGLSMSDLVQQITDLKRRQIQVEGLIDQHQAMLKKLGPLYDHAVKQLEQALVTKLEIDTLLGYTEQLLIDAEVKSNKLAKDE
jgi:hypothetical protein